jgi:signal transduction histidine kinase
MNHENGQKHEAPLQEGGNRGGAIDEAGNVDRIRNILFGSQMRDYDGRFRKLEERLAREAGELRSDVQKRLEALETFMKGEVATMTERVRTEQAERTQAMERIARDLGETAKGLEGKIRGLDEHAAKEVRELRQQLLEQSKALSAEIKEKNDHLQAGLDHEAQDIRGAMTGREALAEMLQEVSLRLKNEFRVPGA